MGQPVDQMIEDLAPAHVCAGWEPHDLTPGLAGLEQRVRALEVRRVMMPKCSATVVPFAGVNQPCDLVEKRMLLGHVGGIPCLPSLAKSPGEPTSIRVTFANLIRPEMIISGY